MDVGALSGRSSKLLPRFWSKIKMIRLVNYDQQGGVEKEKAPGHLFGDVTDEAHLVQR